MAKVWWKQVVGWVGALRKFSIVCAMLGYQLWVYDSFEGVEAISDKKISREVGTSLASLLPSRSLSKRMSQNSVSAGYARLSGAGSRDTLAKTSPPGSVCVAYIDCDLAKGNEEALVGILPALSTDGVVFSQDYHIDSVRFQLNDPLLSMRLRVEKPRVFRFGERLVSFTFPNGRLNTAKGADLAVTGVA